MRLAYTISPGKGDIDALLRRVAERAQQIGLRTCGTVQINTECESGGPCDMDVQVLPDGPTLRISQSLGKDARGCRLDPEALEQAIALCEKTLPDADVLIVNKFGKHEASGRGFRPLIGTALLRDMPVLVGLNRLNEQAFQDFTGGIAVPLAPDFDAISGWLEASSDLSGAHLQAS